MASIEEREEAFKREIQEIGGLLYKRSILEDFCDYWLEPDRSKKPKLKFEKQSTWKSSLRLKTWARNCVEKKSNPYLSEGEKTIEQKKRDFIGQLRPFLDKYGKSTLNSFYSWYTETNQKGVLRYENEAYFEMSSRIERWHKMEQERSKQKAF
jgi:hypothetical protein